MLLIILPLLCWWRCVKLFLNPCPKEVQHDGISRCYELHGLSADEREKNTIRTYDHLLTNFQNHFGDIDLSSITSEQILTFLYEFSKGTKPSTKRLRFTLLSAFFNFIKNSFEPELQNPCDNLALRKMFRSEKLGLAKILDTK